MKQYAVHGKSKGKKIFESSPVAHVWANSEGEAKERGNHIIKNNPIYNEHYSDDVKAQENLPGA